MRDFPLEHFGNFDGHRHGIAGIVRVVGSGEFCGAEPLDLENLADDDGRRCLRQLGNIRKGLESAIGAGAKQEDGEEDGSGAPSIPEFPHGEAPSEAGCPPLPVLLAGLDLASVRGLQHTAIHLVESAESAQLVARELHLLFHDKPAHAFRAWRRS